MAKYGGGVPTSRAQSDKWFDVMKCYSPGDGITKADLEHSTKLYEACFHEEAAIAEQAVAFKPLLDAYMVEFAKLPANVQAKYNKQEMDWMATGKPMNQSPDHLKGLQVHAACSNGSGCLNE
jgi:hypothetical protein